MEKSKLSSYYFIACDRIHQIVDDLYEALHKETGVPVETSKEVEDALEGVRSAIYQEIDLIRTAVDEHGEQ